MRFNGQITQRVVFHGHRFTMKYTCEWPDAAAEPILVLDDVFGGDDVSDDVIEAIRGDAEYQVRESAITAETMSSGLPADFIPIANEELFLLGIGNSAMYTDGTAAYTGKWKGLAAEGTGDLIDRLANQAVEMLKHGIVYQIEAAA